MSCSHEHADDFVAEAECPNGHVEEVEFHTCLCYSGAYGECPECETVIHLQSEDAEP